MIKETIVLIALALVFTVCTVWRYNAPRPPWTNYEQEFTRHPSAKWGYGGKNDVLIREGKFHDGVYRGRLSPTPRPAG